MYCKGMPKIVDHNQRRAEIILGLWAVISEHGIEGVTFQAVARAAGISVGRIQHYFTSKDELVLAGCQAIVDGASVNHEERVEGLDTWEILTEMLIQPIPRTPEFRLGVSVWYAYLARAVVDPRIGEIMRAAMRGTREEVEELLKRAGASTANAPRLAALSEGLTQQVLIGAIDANEAVETLRSEIKAVQSEMGPRNGRSR